MQDIPQYNNFVKIVPVNKGWSSDKKYTIEMKNGEKLLLRLADISEFNRKKEEYEAICTVSKQGIPMSQPVEFGVCNVGNMIASYTGELSIIDFNRLDYGDPWEEFNRIVWCANCSRYFASGRINGYFNNDVPHEFFNLLALYISSNTLSSIYWAIPFGQAEVDTMINQAKGVLVYYDGMTNTMPKWYMEEML